MQLKPQLRNSRVFESYVRSSEHGSYLTRVWVNKNRECTSTLRRSADRDSPGHTSGGNICPRQGLGLFHRFPLPENGSSMGERVCARAIGTSLGADLAERDAGPGPATAARRSRTPQRCLTWNVNPKPIFLIPPTGSAELRSGLRTTATAVRPGTGSAVAFSELAFRDP